MNTRVLGLEIVLGWGFRVKKVTVSVTVRIRRVAIFGLGLG